MVSKPQNHVTRALEANSPRHQGSPFPDLTQAQLDWLNANYPPRCYDHRGELIEDHLKYSGVVAFAAGLKAQWEARLVGEVAIDADAERAQNQP